MYALLNINPVLVTINFHLSFVKFQTQWRLEWRSVSNSWLIQLLVNSSQICSGSSYKAACLENHNLLSEFARLPHATLSPY